MDDIRERFYGILDDKKQFLMEGETLILIKNGQMIAQYNDGEDLCEVSGNINQELQTFLYWLYDKNKY